MNPYSKIKILNMITGDRWNMTHGTDIGIDFYNLVEKGEYTSGTDNFGLSAFTDFEVSFPDGLPVGEVCDVYLTNFTATCARSANSYYDIYSNNKTKFGYSTDPADDSNFTQILLEEGVFTIPITSVASGLGPATYENQDTSDTFTVGLTSSKQLQGSVLDGAGVLYNNAGKLNQVHGSQGPGAVNRGTMSLLDNLSVSMKNSGLYSEPLVVAYSWATGTVDSGTGSAIPSATVWSPTTPGSAADKGSGLKLRGGSNGQTSDITKFVDDLSTSSFGGLMAISDRGDGNYKIGDTVELNNGDTDDSSVESLTISNSDKITFTIVGSDAVKFNGRCTGAPGGTVDDFNNPWTNKFSFKGYKRIISSTTVSRSVDNIVGSAGTDSGVSTTTDGSGTSLTLDVTCTNDGAGVSTFTAAIAAAGTGYAVGDTITVAHSDLFNIDPTRPADVDLTFKRGVTTTNGTNIVGTAGTDSGVSTTTDGMGDSLTLNVTCTNDIDGVSTYTATVANAGSGYADGDIITVAHASLSNILAVDNDTMNDADLTFEVGVFGDNAEDGSIVGTAATDLGVSTTTSGSGTSLTLDVTCTTNGASVSVFSVTVDNAGSRYALGDTITVAHSELSNIDPYSAVTNVDVDITFNVATVAGAYSNDSGVFFRTRGNTVYDKQIARYLGMKYYSGASDPAAPYWFIGNASTPAVSNSSVAAPNDTLPDILPGSQYFLLNIEDSNGLLKTKSYSNIQSTTAEYSGGVRTKGHSIGGDGAILIPNDVSIGYTPGNHSFKSSKKIYVGEIGKTTIKKLHIKLTCAPGNKDPSIFIASGGSVFSERNNIFMQLLFVPKGMDIENSNLF